MTDIRAAQLHDVKKISLLVADYWKFEGLADTSLSTIHEVLCAILNNGKYGFVLLAEAGESVVGYIIIVYVFSTEHGGLTAEIDELYVDHEHRSCSVGATLLTHAESLLKKENICNISLQVGVDNMRARHFYRRHAFSARDKYGLMEKDLNTTSTPLDAA